MIINCMNCDAKLSTIAPRCLACNHEKHPGSVKICTECNHKQWAYSYNFYDNRFQLIYKWRFNAACGSCGNETFTSKAIEFSEYSQEQRRDRLRQDRVGAWFKPGRIILIILALIPVFLLAMCGACIEGLTHR